MFNKKCRECAEKVDRKFNYCPWCGASLRVKNRDMGMLGASDSGDLIQDLKLPFGIDKIMGSLVRQLEKQLGDMEIDENTGMPKGFRIKIAHSPVGNPQIIQNNAKKREGPILVVSKEEAERRAHLKKVDAESRVKRLGDTIVYEIDAPGIGKKENVVVTELETGIEIRAYAKDKCYVKTIPMKVEILEMRVDRDKVSVEMKG